MTLVDHIQHIDPVGPCRSRRPPDPHASIDGKAVSVVTQFLEKLRTCFLDDPKQTFLYRLVSEMPDYLISERYAKAYVRIVAGWELVYRKWHQIADDSPLHPCEHMLLYHGIQYVLQGLILPPPSVDDLAKILSDAVKNRHAEGAIIAAFQETLARMDHEARLNQSVTLAPDLHTLTAPVLRPLVQAWFACEEQGITVPTQKELTARMKGQAKSVRATIYEPLSVVGKNWTRFKATMSTKEAHKLLDAD